MSSYNNQTRGRASSLVLGLVAVAALAVFLVLIGHGYHVLAFFPLLVLFACPLLHMTMHRGHSSHGAITPNDGSPGRDA